MRRRWYDVLIQALACATPGYLPPRIRDLTDEDLWSEWHSCGAALARARPRQALALVAQRQECLDELARRDPAGCLLRLTDGRVAASDDLLRLLSADG